MINVGSVMKKILIVTLLPLAGCTAFGNPEYKTIRQPSAAALVQPSNVRSAYFRDGKVCAEPPPDLGFQPSFGSSASVETNAGAKGGGSINYNATVVPLAGRNAHVLFGRDAGALLCMLAMNGFLNTTEVRSGYSEYLNAAIKFAEADRASAEAEKAVADVELAKIASIAQVPIPAAIVTAAQTHNQKIDSASDAVAARFTAQDGSFAKSDFDRFLDDSVVKAILPPAAIVHMKTITSRSELVAILTTSYESAAESLAARAKTF